LRSVHAVIAPSGAPAESAQTYFCRMTRITLDPGWCRDDEQDLAAILLAAR